MPVPSSPASVVPSAPTDWRHIVAELEAARANAFITGDVTALDAVYAPGSAALAADSALLRRGVRSRGFWITTIAVRQVVVMPDQATLRVTDAMQTRPSRTFTMQLLRTATGWRIAAIQP